MVLFIVLGIVVLITFAVLGVLFYMLGKEGDKTLDEKAVSLNDSISFKKDIASSLLQPQKPYLDVKDPKLVVPFEPKVSLPTQEVRTPIEDEIYKKRASELEDELKSISEKAQTQSDDAKMMIESLTEENESLKRQKANLEQAQEELKALELRASDLKTENVNLQGQLETTNAKVQLLEQEMTAVRMQMGEEISRATATVTQLKQEKEELLSAPKQNPDDAMHQELEALKSEQVQLQQKYDELERSQLKLREMNTHLIEKNDLLQYEMIKARAQSSGLERVSFNYKNQLEDFLKKAGTAQATNENLSEVKNRLEGMVEEIKLQNEELVRKDQLSQFELEKNRSRIANLERECEELKARTQQGQE